MRKQPYCILVLATLSMSTVVLSGCTHIITTTDIPALQSGSPLRSIESKTFLINEFTDIRKISGDPRIIKKDAGHTFRYDQPPATAVASAVRKELERNGHKTVETSAPTRSDYVIDGAVFKFSTITVGRMFSVTSISTIAVKLTLSRVPNSKGVFVKAYQGIYDSKGAPNIANPLSLETMVLHQALTNMIKDISTDQELIEFLQK
jgi:hypothetical protein